jgi:hypothetical protein
MNFGPTEAVVYAVFVIGTAVSLFGFFRARRLKSGANIPQSVRNDPAFAGFGDGVPVVGGESVVQAPSPKALLDLLTVLLENPVNSSMQSPWAKLSRNTGRILIDRVSEGELQISAENLSIGNMQIHAQAQGPDVRVRWMIEVPGLRFMITIGQLWALGIALPASILGPLLVARYLLGSANPAASGQSFQVLQTFQVVWEPHLFIGIASQRMTAAGRHLDTLIAQAAYELRTGRQSTDAGSFGARSTKL